MRSRRAATRSTRSSAPCPSGRRNTSRTARSGWACRADDVTHRRASGATGATLADLIRATLRRHAMLAGGERVLVGVSGGPAPVPLPPALPAVPPPPRLALPPPPRGAPLRPPAGP